MPMRQGSPRKDRPAAVAQCRTPCLSLLRNVNGLTGVVSTPIDPASGRATSLGVEAVSTGTSGVTLAIQYRLLRCGGCQPRCRWVVREFP